MLPERTVKIIRTENSLNIFINKKPPSKITESGIIEPNTNNNHINFIFFGSDKANSVDHSYNVVMSIGGNVDRHSDFFYIFFEANIKRYISRSLTKEYPFSVILFPKDHLPLEYNKKNYFN